MQNQETLVGTTEETMDPQTKPNDLPSISPKPGWQTSQGQLTGVFGVVALLLSFLGWKFSSDDVMNMYQLIQNAITVIGPLVVFAKVLYEYINSRGKIQSNAMWATASLSTGNAQSTMVSGTPVGFAGGLDLGKLIKGKGWKDPNTYIDLAKIAGNFVPAVGAVTQHLGDDDDRNITDEQITDTFKGLGDRVTKLEQARR